MNLHEIQSVFDEIDNEILQADEEWYGEDLLFSKSPMTLSEALSLEDIAEIEEQYEKDFDTLLGIL